MNILIKYLLIALFFSVVFFLSSTATGADIYSYISPDGIPILTDKSINKKGYRLVKVYRLKQQQGQIGFSKVKVAKRKKYRNSIKKQSKRNGIVYSCANKQHLLSKARIYRNIIQVYANIYGVEEELIYAIVKQESCFNETAHSRSGAIGLMQLMPATATMMKINNPWNPEQNIQAGIKYISEMLRLFKGKKRLAVAAYNAGPGNVRKYQGIPPYRETKNYVKKVMLEYNRLKKQRTL
jgi:soluble lytic murein transglycosylase-like protein